MPHMSSIPLDQIKLLHAGCHCWQRCVCVCVYGSVCALNQCNKSSQSQHSRRGYVSKMILPSAQASLCLDELGVGSGGVSVSCVCMCRGVIRGTAASHSHTPASPPATGGESAHAHTHQTVKFEAHGCVLPAWQACQTNIHTLTDKTFTEVHHHKIQGSV